MNQDKVFKNIYLAALSISIIWLSSYKMRSDSSDIQIDYIIKELVNEKKTNSWQKDRLRNCTGSNLIHYSIIQDCDNCGRKAAKNDDLRRFYVELQ